VSACDPWKNRGVPHVERPEAKSRPPENRRTADFPAVRPGAFMRHPV